MKYLQQILCFLLLYYLNVFENILFAVAKEHFVNESFFKFISLKNKRFDASNAHYSILKTM